MTTQRSHKTRQTDQKPRLARPESQGLMVSMAEADREALQRAVADPRRSATATILALQRTVGNQAIAHLLQPKPGIAGPVGDPYEQEAKPVAEQMTGLSPAATSVPTAAGKAGRRPHSVQRRDKEEELQTWPLSRSLYAQSLTHDSDTHFGRGQYNSDTTADKRLLAHESTRVAQQTAGAKSSPRNLPHIGVSSGGPVQRGLVKSFKRGAKKLTKKVSGAAKGALSVAKRWGRAGVKAASNIGKFAQEVRQYGREFLIWVKEVGAPTIKDWLKQAGKALVRALKASGPKILQFIKQAPRTILEALRTYGPKIFEWLKAAPDKILAALKKFGIQVFKWIKAAPGKILAAIKEYGPKVFQWIKEAPAKMIQFIIEFGKTLFQALLTLGSLLIQLIKALAGFIIRSLLNLDKLIGMAARLLSRLRGKGENDESLFKKVIAQITKIANAVANIGERVLGWIVQLPKIILDAINEYGPQVLVWISEIPSKLLAALKEYGPMILAWIVQAPKIVIEGAKQYGLELFGWIKQAPSKLMEAIKKHGIELLQRIKEAPTKIINAIKKYGVMIIEGFLKIADKVITWLNEHDATEFFEWLSKFAKAIIEGVTEFGPILLDLIKEVGADILAAWEAVKELIHFFVKVLNKGWGAISAILQDPVTFLKNLGLGVSQGAEKFLQNLFENVLKGVFIWLFEGVGVHVPEDVTPLAVLNMGMEVMGLGYENVTGRLNKGVDAKINTLSAKAGSTAQKRAGKKAGEKAKGYAKSTGDKAAQKAKEGLSQILSSVLTIWQDQGPAFALQYIAQTILKTPGQIVEKAKELYSQMVTYIKTEMFEKLKQGVARLIPGIGQLLQALDSIKSTIEAIRALISDAREILETVQEVIDMAADIIAGKIEVVATKVEELLTEKGIPVIVKAIATYFDVQAVVDKMNTFLEKLRKPVNDFIDKFLDKIWNSVADPLMKAVAGSEE